MRKLVCNVWNCICVFVIGVVILTCAVIDSLREESTDDVS